MQIADRMRGIDASGVRKVFELACKMRDPIDLSIGQPDFGPPGEVVRKTVEALGTSTHRYTLTQGIEELRAEVRAHLEKSKEIRPDDVMITSGAAGGILLSFLALVNPGDRVIIPDPYFVIYKQLCHVVGAVPVFLDTYPDFTVTAERLEKVIGKGDRLLVLNSPSNPTGRVLHREQLKEIAALARRAGCGILSDEVYDFFSYDSPFESIGRYSEDVIVLGGYSKTLGIPGWRVGYAAGPAHVIREMIKLQQYSFVCAPSVLQYGVLGALSVDMSAKLGEYRKKRDMLCNAIEGIYRFSRPEGAFYLFPEAPGSSGEAFARRAIEKNLLVVPGSVFSERDTHFRISFAASDDTLVRGIEALKSLA